MTKTKHTRSDGVFTSAATAALDLNVKALAGDLPPVLYAFRMPRDLIKIGYSTSLNTRRKNLHVRWSDLLAIKPGTMDEELALHRSIGREHRYHGEFYYPTPHILAIVNDWRSAFNLPPVRVKTAA